VRTAHSAFGVLLLAIPVCAVAQEGPDHGVRIPEGKIKPLRAELVRRGTEPSLVKKRRTCKSIARKGAALLEAYPAAPNRFSVLGIMLQSQKRLLELENSSRNRKALFETCTRLAKAPDEYADVRLEADMLLSERGLTARNATPDERVEALEEMIERYRDTPGDAKCLKMASLIARALDARELERAILDAMDERFSDDPGMIVFRRSNLSLQSIMIRIAGRFERVDGTTLFLPVDRIGHHYIMVFWSEKTPNTEVFLKQVEEQRSRYGDMIEVYSFNLDEKEDAAEGTLHRLGLDWTAMRLPGGKRSQTFRAYAVTDPTAIFINPYGYTILEPPGARKESLVGMRGAYSGTYKINDARVSHDRYVAQVQSLFIGDFLVTDPEVTFDPACPPELRMFPVGEGRNAGGRPERTTDSVPAEVLAGIQGCFIVPPLRYRLTRAEAHAGYEKAEGLCRDAIERFPQAPDLWIVRNRRMIALLGLWSFTSEPKYLDMAAAEAEASLAGELPRGADVVPRFCLARKALRRESPDPESVIAELVDATGGVEAPGSSLAAAAVLALHADSWKCYDRYRNQLLKDPAGHDPALWPFMSFLRNRYHAFHMLQPNRVRHEGRSFRSYIVNHFRTPMTDPLPEIELKTLEGNTLTLPRDTAGRLTLLLFIEPPADPNADFPVVLDRRGKPTTNDMIRRVMEYATTLTDTHVNKDVTFVAAFLCDDAKRVESLMKKNGWNCQAAMVPGGLANPMVNRLGVLSADRMPNVFLLRRDGTVAWWTSGLVWKAEFGYPFAVLLGMKVHIEVCEVETAYKALEKGDYAEAARVFAGPFKPALPERYRWRSPRHHGRALALMGLDDWDGALEAIDMSIDDQKLRYFRGRRRRGIQDWRKDAATVLIKETTDVFAELWTVKAIILERLGRKDEAAALRKRAAGPAKAELDSPYKAFHEKLKKFRLDRY